MLGPFWLAPWFHGVYESPSKTKAELDEDHTEPKGSSGNRNILKSYMSVIQEDSVIAQYTDLYTLKAFTTLTFEEVGSKASLVDGAI